MGCNERSGPLESNWLNCSRTVAHEIVFRAFLTNCSERRGNAFRQRDLEVWMQFRSQTAASYTLSAQWEYVEIVSDGSQWLIVGSN